MPTGACGINCETCKLHLMEICSSCGPGRSVAAQHKLAAQERLLGAPCPILACAAARQVDYCLRDCADFPCENFGPGAYPFSAAFLAMQTRRRQELPPALSPNRTPITVPAEYWQAVGQRDPLQLAAWTQSDPHPDGGLVFSSLNATLWLDIPGQRLAQLRHDRWTPLADPLLELLSLLYFKGVEGLWPVGRDIIGVKDLKEAHYFVGVHELDLKGLLTRYGDDAPGLQAAAAYLGGTPLDLADAAYELRPFPRLPLYVLWWRGDAEFAAKISILFDRGVEKVFSASAIWMLVKYMSRGLLRGPGRAAGSTGSDTPQ